MMKKLAINGGKPVRSKPWAGNITTGEEEKQAVMEVMDNGYLSLFEGSHKPDLPFSFWGGPKVQQLERDWCEYYDIKYAVSMNSATSGLYAAIGALGIGYGDEIIVSPYAMSACAACTLVYGAIPIFADVELETGCLDPKSIEEKITVRTKAIIVVHQFGIPADMDHILIIANKNNIKVIEDCAQSHGAKYKEKYVGTLGDIGIFSLNINKTIQCGEGAVCVTNDQDVRYRLALIRNHGEAVVEQAGYENIVNIIGFNYRLTEIQAAIAIEQLKKLKHFNDVRLEMVMYLNEQLTAYNSFIVPEGRAGCYSTYYIYPLRYIPESLGIERERLVEMINREGIMFFQGYVKPLYLQPLYQRKLAFKNGYPWIASENKMIKTNYYKGACPNAEILYFEQMIISEHIRIPHGKQEIEDILTAIRKVIEAVKR